MLYIHSRCCIRHLFMRQEEQGSWVYLALGNPLSTPRRAARAGTLSFVAKFGRALETTKRAFPVHRLTLGLLRFRHPRLLKSHTFGTMAALTASMVSCPTAPVAAKPFSGLSRSSLPCKALPTFVQRTVSNGARTRQMLVWEPVNNK